MTRTDTPVLGPVTVSAICAVLLGSVAVQTGVWGPGEGWAAVGLAVVASTSGVLASRP